MSRFLMFSVRVVCLFSVRAFRLLAVVSCVSEAPSNDLAWNVSLWSVIVLACLLHFYCFISRDLYRLVEHIVGS